MLKVRLLNDGGYADMENVKFPVIAYGHVYDDDFCVVFGNELVKAAWREKACVANFRYFFEHGTECEVINEE